MAQQAAFAYKTLNIDKSQLLGRGSYGAVYKAKCDQLPCAAKVLHPTILDPTDPGAGKIMTKFKQECAFLGSILHPYIVQYLGMTRDPESRLPVLLMELLDENLTKMLERSQQSLAYYVQVDICHDIALAVAYLHSNDIIHRDLSSNNVLIIARRRAKVTDFGMSKLAGATPTKTPLTVCPGTVAYMPPEALREPPRYTKKLDCFSEGVIMIQVCTRLWPEPGSRTKLIQDFRSPTGSTEMPVLETERRKNHIDLVDPTHALLPIAMDCLQYQVDNRPSSEELCQKLAGFKEAKEYRERLKEADSDKKTHEMKRQIYELREKAAKNVQKIQKQQDEIKKRDDQIKVQAELLKEKEQELQQEKSELQGELASQERYVHLLNKQLEEQERVTAEIQQINISLQEELQQTKVPGQQKQVLSQQKQVLSQQQHSHPGGLSPLPPPLPPKPTTGRKQLYDKNSPTWSSQTSLLAVKSTHTPKSSPQHSYARNYVYLNLQMRTKKKVAFNWRNGGSAPIKMVRGDTVTNGNEAYFVNYSSEVCSYNSATKAWQMLPKCPYQGCSLAMVNGLLTLIGGFEGGIIRSPKNQLFSLSSARNTSSSTTDYGWIVLLPPMPTKRCNTAAITTEEGKLIVAGGESGTTYMQRLSTVEVMDTKTLVWSAVASLPHPYSSTSVAICEDDLYLLGGLDSKKETKSVITCSLTELVQSNGETMSVWYRAADSANYYSTCAAVNGELLAVGGCDDEGKAVGNVYKYKSSTNSWDLISNMPTARYQCLVAVLSTDEMMAVGGNEHSTPTDIVEITTS